MKVEYMEAEVRFIAQNAKHNLELVRGQADLIDPVKLNRSIKWLEMMIDLNNQHLAFAKEEQKKARRSGRTPLSTRLKYLVASILTVESTKRKEARQ
ncbi:hypothetical protein [Paenibacillus sp. sgz500958]|uniref:hypothetical protein n=1 Tax=Paenibacillus sp. sgz500958 TaxID=3242475 RepID=UPI0036D3538D